MLVSNGRIYLRDSMDKVINFLETIIRKYKIKHPEYSNPIYICEDVKTRNRYKNDEYKIPEDQPQCPVYKDNRCCGGCELASECEHCVNCGCFGFTYAQMGGTDKQYYMHKASQYYCLGRIGEDGKFDWNYYYANKKKKSIIPGKFICVNGRFYKVTSKVNRFGKFSVISCKSHRRRKFKTTNFDDYIRTYDDLDTAKLFNRN